jgi:hypothetical protein
MLAVLLAGGPRRALAGGPKQSGPWLQLSLEDLGYPGSSHTLLESGASLLTVHFIDDHRLLVTYNTRSLIPRIPNDPPGDEDRIVAAEIVDLPFGHVAAKTTWRMHDYGRYLWHLGGGDFLVRIGDQFYTMSPGSPLNAKNPFQRVLFPGRGMKPMAVHVSPDGGLLTVETQINTSTAGGGTTVVFGDSDSPAATAERTRTLIDFYRLQHTDGTVVVSHAGAVLAPNPLNLPVDSDGLLWARQVDSSGAWTMSFDEFGGKSKDLGKIASSCQPLLQMLDASEFLALSCRGGTDRITAASFGLDGKETWEEPMGDLGVPTFVLAPAASRFALSHTAEAIVPIQAGLPGTPARQEVRVYQDASGDLLLNVESMPIMKSAENFDLSQDGTLAAVVRNEKLAIYKLPPLTERDREDMAEVAKFAPPAISAGPVALPLLAKPAATAVTIGPPAAAVQVTPVAPAAPPAPRKPPTFLEPGEKPEFGSPNEPPPGL